VFGANGFLFFEIVKINAKMALKNQKRLFLHQKIKKYF
jgi:hypothetical protein